MLNYIITCLIAIVAVVGSFFPRNSAQIWDEASNIFGTTAYPTSLDTLTNPSGTDSVATVSHSSQHSNANDAIEAIEAKVGIGASTPTSGTVLYGNGTGSSAWSATPTITSLTLTNLNLTGSTTLQAFTGTNATTTNATSTNSFYTPLLSSITASSTNFLGAGLSTCSASDKALTWTGGKFGCNTFASSEIYLDATSTITTTGTNVRTATTTSSLIGENFMIWASCSIDVSTRNALSLNVKPAGSATSTIGMEDLSDAPGDAYNTQNLMGFYTAIENGAIEIYVGGDASTYYYQNCKWPQIMFIKS